MTLKILLRALTERVLDLDGRVFHRLYLLKNAIRSDTYIYLPVYLCVYV